MRYLITPACLLAFLVLVTGAARAEDEAPQEAAAEKAAEAKTESVVTESAPKDEDRNARRAERWKEMRQKMLGEFDADGDGELNEAERTKAREVMRSRRGGRQGNRARGGEGGQGVRPNGRPGGPAAGPDRQGGRAGRGGPGSPPDPAKLFDRFDANKDGQLSRDEFKKLSAEMRSAGRPAGPARARGENNNRRGPRAEGERPRGQRPEGSPPEGRRRFDRNAPLQNPSDQAGPRARPAGRRLYDEDAPQRGSRGAMGRGFGAPNSDRVFDRFDENKDGQLSRDEFMKWADQMRRMRERFMDRQGEQRPGGQPRGGARDGRGGSRRGPGGEGGAPPRRPRPRRPDMETGVTPEISTNVNDTV